MAFRNLLVAMLLIIAGAFPAFAQLDANGRLRGAAFNNKPEELAQALDEGADVNSVDQNGYTALMWAAQNNRADMVKTLLEHGADPNLKSATGLTAVRMGRDYPAILALLKAHGAVIPQGYVVGSGGAATGNGAPRAVAPTAAPGTAGTRTPARSSASAAPGASTKAYCRTMYARAYSLCGASARDCKIIAASNWETCENTGRWP